MHNIKGFIKNKQDAALLSYAIKLNYLQPNTERLNGDERAKIRAGDMFCYIKGDMKLKRWTDGFPWSGSRISGAFLVYEAAVAENFNQVNYNKLAENISDYQKRSIIPAVNRNFCSYKKSIFEENRFFPQNRAIAYDDHRNPGKFSTTLTYNKFNYNNMRYPGFLLDNVGPLNPSLNSNPEKMKILKKRTISFTHENKTYHFINYYDEFLDMGTSIQDLPFFSSLKVLLDKYPEFTTNSFLKDKKIEDVHRMLKEKGLVEFDKNIYSSELKRRMDEEIAMQALLSFSMRGAKVKNKSKR